VFVEGPLVSSTYEQPNGKGKKSKTTKITSWSIRRRCRAQAGSFGITNRTYCGGKSNLGVHKSISTMPTA
jgi:hypothetical protein